MYPNKKNHTVRPADRVFKYQAERGSEEHHPEASPSSEKRSSPTNQSPGQDNPVRPTESKFATMQKAHSDNEDTSVVEIHFSLFLERHPEPAPYAGAVEPIARINSMDWCPTEGEKQSIIDEAIKIGTEGEPRIADILSHRCPNTRRIYIVMDIPQKPFLEEVVPFLQQFLHLEEMEFEYGIDVSIAYSQTAADKGED
jgi:hypothetical protein